MVIEYARNVVGLAGASSSEFDPETGIPVMRDDGRAGGDPRRGGDLGGIDAPGPPPLETRHEIDKINTGCTDRAASRNATVTGYEVNNAYRAEIAAAGLDFSGASPGSSPVEFRGLPREVHPITSAPRRIRACAT
jgi:CTP synthase